jgi:hypothetical protein
MTRRVCGEVAYRGCRYEARVTLDGSGRVDVEWAHRTFMAYREWSDTLHRRVLRTTADVPTSVLVGLENLLRERGVL